MNALATPERAALQAPLTTPHAALRFLTAGSVDDGKSTLIGRLLLDSRAILADQLDQLHARAAAAGGGAAPDLSLLTDGLEAEREQGITIDVAWRYFATPARKFVIADAPGHEQYTRNMVTAAAGSDAVVVLVDITKLDLTQAEVPLLPQTRRHALLAQLLRVDHVVFAVNKIDAVADAGEAFRRVSGALQRFATEAGLAVAGIVPVSALRGDNVAQRTPAAWYDGPSLLELLETLPVAHEPQAAPLALPVQYVARQGRSDVGGTGEQPRVLWGRVARGDVAVGDTVQLFPSGESATVQALLGLDGELPRCGAGRSAGVVLDRMLDVSRGDWLLAPGSVPAARVLRATLAWLDTEPAVPGRRYLLRHGHRWVQARLRAVHHRLDIHTLARDEAAQLQVNDIGEVEFELQQPLPLLPYAHSRVGGALIVVDPASHRTSGALLVQSAEPEAA